MKRRGEQDLRTVGIKLGKFWGVKCRRGRDHLKGEKVPNFTEKMGKKETKRT